jgi:hypothetical protein
LGFSPIMVARGVGMWLQNQWSMHMLRMPFLASNVCSPKASTRLEQLEGGSRSCTLSDLLVRKQVPSLAIFLLTSAIVELGTHVNGTSSRAAVGCESLPVSGHAPLPYCVARSCTAVLVRSVVGQLPAVNSDHSAKPMHNKHSSQVNIETISHA